MDSNNKRIAKNTLMLYIRMFFTMGVALYTSRVVLEVLGVEDFGIYNVVGGVVILFSFLNSAMGASTSRFITIELGKTDFKQLNKVFSASIVNHVLIVASIFILAETVGLWFVSHKLVIPEQRMSAALWVYQFSVFSAMISLMQTPFNALIIAHERMGIYAWGSILDTLLKLFIVFLLLTIEGDKLRTYAILVFIVTVVMLVFYSAACKILFKYCSFSFHKDYSLYKTMLKYSGWDLIGNFSLIAQGQGLNMLLNIFFGPTVNAARGIAYQVQAAITQFGGNFSTAVRPQIIKYYAIGEKEKMMNLVFQSAKYSFFLLWIFTLPLLMEMEYVLSLWLRVVPDHTALFARLALVIGLISAWRSPFISAMHATGKIMMPNIICGSLLIATLPISYYLLKLGLEASSVFIAALIINFINMWIEWLLIKRVVYFSIVSATKKIVLTSLNIALLSGILPLFLNRMVPNTTFLSFSMIVSLSLVCTGMSIYLIGIGANERKFIKSKIKSVLHI